MLTASALKLRDLPSRLYWVYGLVDPRNDEIRYVGQSLEVYNRGEHHKRSSEQPIKRAWIQELQALNLKPRVMLFESAETPEIANQAEKYWISYCREHGANSMIEIAILTIFVYQCYNRLSVNPRITGYNS